MFQKRVRQACSQGGVSGYNATTANLEAPNRNLQSCKDTHARSARFLRKKKKKKSATHYRIHVLPLLNYHSW